MKEFFQMMRRFVSPYKKYLGWAVLLNLLSAVFNIFSFTLLIPILQILFKIDQRTYSFIPWNSDMGIKEVAINNFYYSVSQMIESYGSNSLLFLGLFLAFMTMLKTSCYFASSAVMIPLRTGVVRDIRIMVYSKVMRLPLRFFSEERKGDIIARMSGDVGEVENSITSSLDQKSDSDCHVLWYFASHQLAADTVYLFGSSGNGMGDGKSR